MHSEKYLKELQRLHSKKSFGTAKNIPRGVQDIISKESLTSVLDFGCGKGKPFTQLQDAITVHNYDPVTSPIPLPNDADLVYSSDVLEHIEPEYINEVLTHINSLAEKYIWLRIDTWPARKFLPDGRNAHILLQSTEWWTNIINTCIDGNIVYSKLIKKGKFDVAIEK